jgi:hypothetical protein
MSPMTAEWTDYESETLRQARELFANWRADDGDISDVKLRLEGVPGEASLFVTFTHRDRPGCQFSYTWPLHGWNDDDPEEPDEEVPDNQVTLLRANLTEDLCALGYGLPTTAVLARSSSWVGHGWSWSLNWPSGGCSKATPTGLRPLVQHAKVLLASTDSRHSVQAPTRTNTRDPPSGESRVATILTASRPVSSPHRAR